MNSYHFEVVLLDLYIFLFNPNSLKYLVYFYFIFFSNPKFIFINLQLLFMLTVMPL